MTPASSKILRLLLGRFGDEWRAGVPPTGMDSADGESGVITVSLSCALERANVIAVNHH